MIKNEAEAREALESLRSTINEAIAKGVAPAPREKVRVEPMTNAGNLVRVYQDF